MLSWSWKNHWVIYCFHYSERWIMVLSGLKFHDFIRQNKPMPMLATAWCNWSWSVLHSNGLWGAQRHILCTRGMCSSLLPRLHAQAAALQQVRISQFSFPKRKQIWAFQDHSLTWTKAQQVGTIRFDSKKPSWSKHIWAYIQSKELEESEGLIQKVSRDH